MTCKNIVILRNEIIHNFIRMCFAYDDLRRDAKDEKFS